MKKLPLEKGSLFLILALITGVLFLLVSGIVSSSDPDEEETLESYEISEKRCEEKLEALLCGVKGIDKAAVMVSLDEVPSEKERPHVRGVAIVLTGSDNAELRLRVTMLVSTALGISSDKVFVTFS